MRFVWNSFLPLQRKTLKENSLVKSHFDIWPKKCIHTLAGKCYPRLLWRFWAIRELEKFWSAFAQRLSFSCFPKKGGRGVFVNNDWCLCLGVFPYLLWFLNAVVGITSLSWVLSNPITNFYSDVWGKEMLWFIRPPGRSFKTLCESLVQKES